MKVLQICAAYKPAYIYGGPTMSVAMLGEQLAKAGIFTNAYTTTANGKEELPVYPGKPFNIDGVTVTYFKRITKDHSHFSPGLFKNLWSNARNFDLVHIHAWWNLVSLFSCIIALTRNVPVLVSPRGTLSAYSFGNKNIGIKWLIHHLYSRPMLKRCHIHVTSALEAEAVARIINSKSVTCIPNFVKLATCLPTAGRDENVLQLLFFSRIEKKKGLDLLINALPFLTFPYNLTIAGDGDAGYIGQLKALAKSKAVNSKITWAGFQTDSEKFKLLAAHHLLILPSHDENFGNVVIESLSQGTAVLVSPFVGLSSYITENKLGWVCPLNADAIGDTLNVIHGKQGELQRIRTTAPAIISADFDENNLLQQYADLYTHITNG